MSYKASEDRYSSMKYNRCGKSGLKLPAMSLGLWHNFGSESDFDNAKAMLLAAFDKGITHFDIANNYGPIPGSAEETMGKVLANELKPYRDELVISTKAGYTMWEGPYGDWGSRKYLISSLDQSLKRLGIDYVDIFYHHRMDPNTPLEETMGALADIVRSGKALYVGLSNYGPQQLEQASKILKSMGVHCLIHQHRFSMLERKTKALLPVLKQEGIGSIAFCPLAQGLLTGKYLNGIPKDSRAAGSSVFLNSNAITPEYLKKARALNDIAQKRGQSLAQMALAYALMDGELTSVILGASKVSQIEENLGALENLTFDMSEIAEIEAVLNDSIA